MTEYMQVQTAVDSKKAADNIAKHVVEKKVAACAQVIGPIDSTYWWKGKIESAQEWLCLMKTTKGKYAKLETAVRSIHPYEVPEIIATEIEIGGSDYLNWIKESI